MVRNNMASILNRSKDSGRKSPDRRVSFGTVERYDISLKNDLEAQLPPSPKRERAHWLIASTQIGARVRRALSLAFAPSYGDSVTYGEILDFLIDYEVVTDAEQVNEKAVVETISSLFPDVLVKPNVKYTCVFVNLENRVEDVVKEELINVTTEEIDTGNVHALANGSAQTASMMNGHLTDAPEGMSKQNGHTSQVKISTNSSTPASTTAKFQSRVNFSMGTPVNSPADVDFKPIGSSELTNGSAELNETNVVRYIVPKNKTRVHTTSPRHVAEGIIEKHNRPRSSRGFYEEMDGRDIANGDSRPRTPGSSAPTPETVIWAPPRRGSSEDSRNDGQPAGSPVKSPRSPMPPPTTPEEENLVKGIQELVNALSQPPPPRSYSASTMSLPDVLEESVIANQNLIRLGESYEERAIDVPDEVPLNSAMIRRNSMTKRYGKGERPNSLDLNFSKKQTVLAEFYEPPSRSESAIGMVDKQPPVAQNVRGHGTARSAAVTGQQAPSRSFSEADISPIPETAPLGGIPMRREGTLIKSLVSPRTDGHAQKKNTDSSVIPDEEHETRNGHSGKNKGLKRSLSMQHSKRPYDTDHFNRAGSYSEKRGAALRSKTANHQSHAQPNTPATLSVSKVDKPAYSRESSSSQFKRGTAVSSSARLSRADSSARSSFRGSNSSISSVGSGRASAASARSSFRESSKSFSRDDDARSSVRSNSGASTGKNPKPRSTATNGTSSQSTSAKAAPTMSRENSKVNMKGTRNKRQEKDFAKISAIFNDQNANATDPYKRNGEVESSSFRRRGGVENDSFRRRNANDTNNNSNGTGTNGKKNASIDQFIEQLLTEIIERDFYQLVDARLEMKHVYKHIRKRFLDMEKEGMISKRLDIANYDISHYFDCFFGILSEKFDMIGCELRMDSSRNEKLLHLIHVAIQTQNNENDPGLNKTANAATVEVMAKKNGVSLDKNRMKSHNTLV